MPVRGPTTDHELIRQWANALHFLPAEKLPAYVDGEPAELRFVSAAQVKLPGNMRVISWEDFFAKFDQHGLALVYDDDSSEILQIEAKSPYRHPKQRPYPAEN